MNNSIIKLLNKIFTISELKVLHYPLRYQDGFVTCSEDISKLIEGGYLHVVPYTPSARWTVLRVSSSGLVYITSQSKYYVEYKRNQRRNNREITERKSHIDEYKTDKSPFMGWKLTRNGSSEICSICNVINRPCVHSQEFRYILPVEARPPRKNASKKKWSEFKQLFNIGY